MTIKTINMHKDADIHEFDTVEEACNFFSKDYRTEILRRYEVVDGLTHGKETRVKNRIDLAVWKKPKNPNDIYNQLFDMPSDIIIIEDQESKLHPLG